MLKHTIEALMCSAIFISISTFADSIPILNHNFDSDVIPANSSSLSGHISGWVNSGNGAIGVWAPPTNGTYYDEIGNRGQVAFLAHGGRISQTVSSSLLKDETYTISFDAGWPKTHNYPNFVVRIKTKGLVIAQKQSSNFALQAGLWQAESFTFTATETMPIGEPLVVEFSNLSSEAMSEIDIDNVVLTTAGTGTDLPADNLGPFTMIMEDTTLLVPDHYPNINVALRYLDDKQIKVGKTVTIQVTDCTNQVYTQSVNVTHPNGDAIHIVGNTMNPESCVLQFNGSDGFTAENGHKVGLIDGFQINGNRTQHTYGISVRSQSHIKLGENVKVSHFFGGLISRNNSTIFANHIEASNNIGNGFAAFSNSYISASDSVASQNHIGYSSLESSQIDALRSHAFLNNSGFIASNGGGINAHYSNANDNVEIGFGASINSRISAGYSSATGNHFGYHASKNSFIWSKEVTASDNDIDFSPIRGQEGNSSSWVN